MSRSRHPFATVATVAICALVSLGLPIATAGNAQAKDAFCTKWEAIAKGMGAIDFDHITKHITAMAKVTKSFKDAESSAPKVIKADFKTVSGVIQKMNDEVQKLKNLDEKTAQAKLTAIEPTFKKMADKVGYEKAIASVGTWSATCK